ncbi:PREDICTED: uncharacterized protein LOC105958264 [Erythranthe guttata]|uniref:uncharacterized protein LOC105958264 n=1 Tax=Erythranthe guttata TaxID=4155 RepID=UPI00064DF3BA|nr:PREDICTED: uncharacterized protein LOC105958264 [Erythranthe guttata]|eukprot:XP_012837724.1 PREDICTED: uncharacterized protein LOC105958264 [Erythranthe guttata]
MGSEVERGGPMMVVMASVEGEEEDKKKNGDEICRLAQRTVSFHRRQLAIAGGFEPPLFQRGQRPHTQRKERAMETVYIQKMERERMEKLKKKKAAEQEKTDKAKSNQKGEDEDANKI